MVSAEIFTFCDHWQDGHIGMAAFISAMRDHPELGVWLGLNELSETPGKFASVLIELFREMDINGDDQVKRPGGVGGVGGGGGRGGGGWLVVE